MKTLTIHSFINVIQNSLADKVPLVLLLNNDNKSY